MNKYGLSEQDLQNAQDKISRQRDYLVKNEFITSNGQIKSLLDLSFSANHSYRYYAQLANKINTMESIALNDGLISVFCTMTLDGFYRDLLKGDYKRFNALRASKRDEVLKSVPENDKLGFIRTKLLNNEVLVVKDLYNILNHQMRQFRNGKAFKLLKRNDDKYHFIRTVEPHKDGVPHFHMMFFIPSEYINIFHEDFKRFFVAPRNKKAVSFQTDIKSASAYIMKYITKSFIDIKNDADLDYINAWFVKHRIMRCITSRSVLPQWIYQKCSIFEKDWGYLTDILNSPGSHSEWSCELNCFWIYDTWLNREIAYEYGRLSIYSNDKLIHQVGKVVDNSFKSVPGERVPKSWIKKKEYISIFENDKVIYYYKDGVYYKNKTHITQLSDLDLYDLHNNYDLENSNYTHYLAIKNLMISRGLLDVQRFDLNNFNFDTFFLD